MMKAMRQGPRERGVGGKLRNPGHRHRANHTQLCVGLSHGAGRTADTSAKINRDCRRTSESMRRRNARNLPKKSPTTGYDRPDAEPPTGDEPIATRHLALVVSAINGKTSITCNADAGMPDRTRHTKERCGNDWLANASATPAQCGANESQIEAPPDQDTERDRRPFQKPSALTDSATSAHLGNTNSRRHLNQTREPDVRSNCRPLRTTPRNAKQATPISSACEPSETTASGTSNNTGSRPLSRSNAVNRSEPPTRHTTTSQTTLSI